jgi:hypothetical protein
VPIVYRGKLKRDQLLKSRSTGRKTRRRTKRLQRFPLIGCEVVVRFHADIPSKMLREILLQIPHENGATVMSQDFGVA